MTTVSDTGVITDPATGNRWIKATHFHLHHDWPSKSGLRWLIFNSKEFGFESVIRRIGRRVMIDEAAFFVWLKKRPQ